MIVLDTNVLSELMKAEPAQPVQDWLGRQVEKLATTVICEAEILAGIAVLPDGRRKRELEAGAERVLSRGFGDAILPLNSEAVRHFADIVARRQRQGRKIKGFDALIAAIARSHGAAVATRDLDDFEGCGVTLHDPWE